MEEQRFFQFTNTPERTVDRAVQWLGGVRPLALHVTERDPRALRLPELGMFLARQFPEDLTVDLIQLAIRCRKFGRPGVLT